MASSCSGAPGSIPDHTIRNLCLERSDSGTFARYASVSSAICHPVKHSAFINLPIIDAVWFGSISIINKIKHVTMKNGVFWDITPCGSWNNRRFGGTYHLLHQVDKNR
jgi:hypothetical protein